MENEPIRPDVLNFDDIRQLVPALGKHRKLVERIMHFLWVDRVNEVHGHYCNTPGAEFSHKLAEEEFRIRRRREPLQACLPERHGRQLPAHRR